MDNIYINYGSRVHFNYYKYINCKKIKGRNKKRESQFIFKCGRGSKEIKYFEISSIH